MGDADQSMPKYTQQEFESDYYTWRNRFGKGKEKNKKIIKFFVYLMNHPCGLDKKHSKRRDGSTDLDYKKLKEGFINYHLVETPSAPPQQDMNLQQDINKRVLEEEFKNLKDDKSLPLYDCFCFVFLTYSSVEGGQKMLHLNDEKVPLEYIWEKASQIPQLGGKPKIFLIQADDVNLLPDKRSKGGGEELVESVTKRIPTDADRITIMSTMPQCFAAEGKPSLLIQAFVKVMDDNRNQYEDEQDDLLSLTVQINQEVVELFESRSSESQNDKLQVPETISTLSKLLIIEQGNKRQN